MVSTCTYPVALEAVLGAEVALLAQLLAVWALQLARIVVAVFASALARGGRVSSHGDGGTDRKNNNQDSAMYAGKNKGRVYKGGVAAQRTIVPECCPLARLDVCPKKVARQSTPLLGAGIAAGPASNAAAAAPIKKLS